MSNPISGALIKSGLRISRRVNPNGLDPLSSQERTLFNLLNKASNTAFGKHFNFNKILNQRSLNNQRYGYRKLKKGQQKDMEVD